MKKLLFGCLCFFLLLGLIPNDALSLDIATLEFEKVTGNVYIGKQNVPLPDELDPPFPGAYLTVNFYVIANEDKTELVLIDAPVVLPGQNLMDPFLGILADQFSGAEIKGVLLTHDHLDHISGSIMYFSNMQIPVYSSSADLDYTGQYDFDTWMPVPLSLFVTPVGPGFSFSFDGGIFEAIDLKGHSPGQIGYAYWPGPVKDKIKWFFAGDALLAPSQDYVTDGENVTYCFRLKVLSEETLPYVENIENWIESLENLQVQLTHKAKLFPSHGAVEEGEYWRYPYDYITFTLKELFDPNFAPCMAP